ncbi:MAG: hypothetical protein J5876_05130 [Lachnospiraceae bacterium]|nr:hypothetical protein [Lachnospiraceae bacterium]
MDNTNRMMEEERTIDMMVLLVEVLKRIGFLFLWALVFAIILGGIAAYKGYRAIEQSKKNAEKGIELVVNEEAKKQYEEALKAYEQQAASYQAQLDDIQAQISSKEESEQDSFILSTRPEDYYKETIIYYIDTHYTINNKATEQPQNPINSIMQAYRVLIINDAFFMNLQKKVPGDLDINDIKKLVQLDIDMDSAFLQLSVCGKTREQADDILKVSREYLENSYDKISAAISEYEIKVVEILGNTGEGIKGATDGVNEDWEIYLGELSASEEALRERISALVKPEPPIADEMPEQEQVSRRALVKSTIKRAILGGFIGALLAAMYIAIRFILNDYALDEEEMRKRYGLNVLASSKRFPGRGWWKRMLAKLSGDEKRVDGVEEAALLATVNVKSLLQARDCDDKEVLLIGHNINALVELSCLMYGVIAVAGGDIMVDRHAVEMLDDYDNVIIAEEKEAISYGEIGREYEKLQLLNKNVIGIIAL